MIVAIAKREIHSLVRTPLAWILFAVCQFTASFQFLSQIETFQKFSEQLRAMPEAPVVTEVIIVPSFGVSAMLLLFAAPVLTMGAICTERRHGSLHLLYSSPISSWQITLGKFFGVYFVMAMLCLLLAAMPLTLAWGARIDPGVYAAGVLALLLLAAASCAIGVLCSSLTRQSAIAAILSFGFLITLWLLDWASRLGEDGGLFTYLSALNHFQQLASGLVSSSDIAYFLLLCATALCLCNWRLDLDRAAL